MSQTMQKRLEKIASRLPPPPMSLVALLEMGTEAIDRAFRDGSLRTALGALSPIELQELAEALEADT